MIRYRNTDNGMVLEVPDAYAVRYDAACNMQRLDPPEKVTDLAKLKVDQLKAYAREHGIDLAGVKTKAEILAAIASAPAEPVDDPEAEQVMDLTDPDTAAASDDGSEAEPTDDDSETEKP